MPLIMLHMRKRLIINMKEIGFAFIIVMSLWMFERCGNHSPNDEGDADSTVVIKNRNITPDSPKKMLVPAENDDIKFAVEAASSGMAEVTLGKMTQQKGNDKRVKNFGALMVKDHLKANQKLAAIARTESILLPYTPLGVDQKKIDDLKKKSGADFDKAYVKMMIEDHQNDIKLFENAEKNGENADLKAFAKKTLPVLRNHLDAINTIQQGMK